MRSCRQRLCIRNGSNMGHVTCLIIMLPHKFRLLAFPIIGGHTVASDTSVLITKTAACSFRSSAFDAILAGPDSGLSCNTDIPRMRTTGPPSTPLRLHGNVIHLYEPQASAAAFVTRYSGLCLDICVCEQLGGRGKSPGLPIRASDP